jgi:hypothetical protein
VPSALRAQVALIGLLAVLLIPIGTSSLRGLTHVLTCRERSATPFSLDVPADGPPVISSSTVIERGADGEEVSREVCGGLTLDLLIGSRVEDRAEVTLAIANGTDFGWHGSVQLLFDSTPIPVDIGKIDAGATATETFELRLDAGRSYEIEGNLLIGP